MIAIGIYAGMFAVGRHGAANGLDGFDQSAARFTVTCLLLAPLAIGRAKGIMERLGLLRVLVIMSLQGAVYSVVFLSGLNYAPAIYGAALVPGLQPFVVVFLGLFVLGERVEALNIVAFLICLFGCVLMILGSDPAAVENQLLGFTLFGASPLMWGSYTFLLRSWTIEPLDALVVVGVSSGIVFLPPYFAFCGLEALEAPLIAISLQFVYQGLLVGILAALFFALAVKRMGSTEVAALTPSMPAMATIIALLWLNEVPSTPQWLGIGLISAGLVLSKIRGFAPRAKA